MGGCGRWILLGLVGLEQVIGVGEAVVVVMNVGRVVAVGEMGGIQAEGVQEVKEGCVVAGRLGLEHEMMPDGCECSWCDWWRL